MANKKFENAYQKKAQNVPPVWMMRQAGRYHKHYQGLRSQHGFVELCKNSDLACEVTMGPIDDFDFDVAILFSDLLFPLEALGMGLKYEPGPILGWELNSDNISKLHSVDQALPELAFQKEALQKIRKTLPEDKSLIGFVGGPWTLFTYACEGKHAGHLLSAKGNFDLYQKFCETMVPLLIANIQLQLDGGAEKVMVFDTAAGELAGTDFTKLVAPHLEKLEQSYPGQLGYYAKGVTTAHYQHDTFRNGAWAGFGFDHRWDLRDRFDHSRGFVQGNFDQAMLFLPEDRFEKYLLDYLKPFQEMAPEDRAGWVCGLGHGVLPKTPEANVRKFVQTVREVFA